MAFVPFVGASLKIVRAYEHLKALNGLVDSALELELNSVSRRVELGTGDIVYRAKLGWQPPREWGLILGDCVHNLRSALDHMVWDLVILNGETPDGNTEFPIYWNQTRYELKGEAARKLRGVSSAAASVIEEAQPYHGPRPKHVPLWALNELDIADKHRSILLTSSVATLRSFAHFGDLPEPVTFGGTVVDEETEIFRVPARTHAEAPLHPSFTCDVALGDGGPYARLPLRQVTQLLYGVVSRQLHYLEYKLLGVSPGDTTLYPHLEDRAPPSPLPPRCRVVEDGRDVE
jgi:hypothetical protein